MLNAAEKRPTAQVTVEAIWQAVRGRGLGTLLEPATAARLGECDSAARAEGEPLAMSAPLSSREQEITSLVSAGLSNKEVARKLELTEGKIKVHLHNILAVIFGGLAAILGKQRHHLRLCTWVRRSSCSCRAAPRDNRTAQLSGSLPAAVAIGGEVGWWRNRRKSIARLVVRNKETDHDKSVRSTSEPAKAPQNRGITRHLAGSFRSRSRKEMFPECIPVATLDRVIVPKLGGKCQESSRAKRHFGSTPS
jgi:DNA-binding CsgD family transcriptional regulator